MLLSTNVCWHFLISLVLYEQLTAISEGNFSEEQKIGGNTFHEDRYPFDGPYVSFISCWFFLDQFCFWSRTNTPHPVRPWANTAHARIRKIGFHLDTN